MTHSEQINELAEALAEARKNFKSFGKGHTATVTSQKGSSYQYKYGDLADLFDATTEALSAQGLTISQWPDMGDEGKFVLVTLLLHKSGQWMKGRYPLAMYERPQEQGSALTYAKRYAAASVLGIAAEVDDDGAAAQQGKPQPPPPPKGYEDWRDDLAAVAEQGTDALQKVWKESKAEYRTYLTSTNPEAWDSLKKLAAGKKAA